MGWYSRDALLQRTRIKDANCLGRDLFSQLFVLRCVFFLFFFGCFIAFLLSVPFGFYPFFLLPACFCFFASAPLCFSASLIFSFLDSLCFLVFLLLLFCFPAFCSFSSSFVPFCHFASALAFLLRVFSAFLRCSLLCLAASVSSCFWIFYLCVVDFIATCCLCIPMRSPLSHHSW